jgi:protein-S-isoprenylcysteine O-methyltransferase Ste14
MTLVLNTPASLLLLVILLVGALLVFARVRSDYRTLGRLTRPIAILQVAYFCIYALTSYAFLDSRLSQVDMAGPFFIPALILMLAGLLFVLFSMPFLGQRSFGQEVGSLRTSGLYHFSRNPQLVGGFLFIVGYALLWLSWAGAVWAALWLVISHLMVRGEEEHLEKVFGDVYQEYCTRTPRYLGLPGRRIVEK